MNELTLDIIDDVTRCLNNIPVCGDTFYIDGMSCHEMPEAVKERIKWAFDHIYISKYLKAEL